ncbi:MAG: tRNA pseudouridine(38-40) synthase TruA [Simkaniaceae bacterium]|nr:tRNA pseudouridine(38-40) synthase TruA [Simkaniaceae bacterium]
MRNIALTIAYDGTHFLGWQKTKEGPSIEATLESAISQMLQHPVELQAASRTDAGVHASGQVVNFFTQKPFDVQILLKGFNALLPKSIRVMHVKEMPDDFHPTLWAKGKEYHYHICSSQVLSPFLLNKSWHFPKRLNTTLMQEAIDLLIGERDFAAFTNAQEPRSKNTTRRLLSIDIEERSEADYLVKIRGESFLYKMVRNLVGTLAYIGCGKLHIEEIPAIFAAKLRANGAITAPAHGLILDKVEYDFTQ